MGACEKFLKFLPDARAAAGRSKDRSTKVGAVALDDDFNIRGSAYNGFPRGVNDDIEERHQRPLKYKWTCHAEENIVAQAARVGVSLKGCSVLLTELHPCTTCARMMAQAGVVRVFAPIQNAPGNGGEDRVNWDDETRIASEILHEVGVEVVFYRDGEE